MAVTIDFLPYATRHNPRFQEFFLQGVKKSIFLPGARVPRDLKAKLEKNYRLKSDIRIYQEALSFAMLHPWRNLFAFYFGRNRRLRQQLAGRSAE